MVRTRMRKCHTSQQKHITEGLCCSGLNICQVNKEHTQLLHLTCRRRSVCWVQIGPAPGRPAEDILGVQAAIQWSVLNWKVIEQNLPSNVSLATVVQVCKQTPSSAMHVVW